MGYTHYWTQPRDFSLKQWREIGNALRQIIEAQNVPIVGLGGEPSTRPRINDDEIGFNALGDHGCETFYVTRKRAPLEEWQRRSGTPRGWSFCKTRGLPYDTVVTAFLAYLGHVHGFEVSSDGNAADWRAGVSLARRALKDEAIPNPREVCDETV